MAVVNPSMSNAFDHLGLPVCFKMDMNALEQAYCKMQAITHPDRFIGKAALEQRLATEHAIRCSESYTILKDPSQRARAILIAKGVAVPGENGTTIPASAFLLEVMDWRDQIQQATAEKPLITLEQELKQRYQDIEDGFDALIDADLANAYLQLVYVLKALAELHQQLGRLKG